MRAFAVDNKSKPPRTQMNERNLEFYVPDGAQVVEGSEGRRPGDLGCHSHRAPQPEGDEQPGLGDHAHDGSGDEEE